MKVIIYLYKLNKSKLILLNKILDENIKINSSIDKIEETSNFKIDEMSISSTNSNRNNKIENLNIVKY